MHNDIVYTVDGKMQEGVSYYPKPVKLSKLNNKEEIWDLHQEMALNIRNDVDCWTSHTVLIIDTSSSMVTNKDIWGTRSRLDAVWFSVALDYTAERLESGNATVTDVISIVYRFYELSVDYRTILGQPMVAKECHMVVDGMNDTDFRKFFVKEIIKRQQAEGSSRGRIVQQCARFTPSCPCKHAAHFIFRLFNL